MPEAVKAWSPNHWTAKDSKTYFLSSKIVFQDKQCFSQIKKCHPFFVMASFFSVNSTQCCPLDVRLPLPLQEFCLNSKFYFSILNLGVSREDDVLPPVVAHTLLAFLLQRWPLVLHTFFQKALWRYNLHITKLTHLMCTIHWLSVIKTIIQFQNSLSSLKLSVPIK